MTSEKEENFKFGANTFISMAYIKRSPLFLLDLRQNNLNNPDAYSEPGPTSTIESFAKIVNS